VLFRSISKTQLNRLNKRMKDSKEETDKLNDKHFYRTRIESLFQGLFNGEKPDDLLEDVETGFNFFIEKAVYYFKVHDKNLDLEKERQSNHSESEPEESKQTSHSNSDAEDCYNDDKPDYFSEENSDVGNETEDEESKEIINNQFNLINSVKIETNTNNLNNHNNINNINNTNNIVNKSNRLKKNAIISEGVDNIDDLNYNWFESAKRNVKKHNIIPRTKS